jgi:PhzF family phenazine biosynthesis protein
MSVPIYVVDAFTADPFAGNPAAVCFLERPAEAAWMQRVSAEMNHSETAFLVVRADGWGLRWFTPATEVDLCGHATLASAHTLWETGRLEPEEPAQFHTASGPLTAQRRGDRIEMDFPALSAEPADSAPAALAESLGVEPNAVARIRWGWLAELADADAVRTLAPDFQRMKTTVGTILATSRDGGGGEFDFVSRFFAPALGVDEDPVTGAAHCILGPYWSQRLGKDELVGHQVSARGGVVRVTVRGARVTLGGQAVTVLRGELLAL